MFLSSLAEGFVMRTFTVGAFTVGLFTLELVLLTLVLSLGSAVLELSLGLVLELSLVLLVERTLLGVGSGFVLVLTVMRAFTMELLVGVLTSRLGTFVHFVLAFRSVFVFTLTLVLAVEGSFLGFISGLVFGPGMSVFTLTLVLAVERSLLRFLSGLVFLLTVVGSLAELLAMEFVSMLARGLVALVNLVLALALTLLVRPEVALSTSRPPVASLAALIIPLEIRSIALLVFVVAEVLVALPALALGLTARFRSLRNLVGGLLVASAYTSLAALATFATGSLVIELSVTTLRPPFASGRSSLTVGALALTLTLVLTERHGLRSRSRLGEVLDRCTHNECGTSRDRKKVVKLHFE